MSCREGKADPEMPSAKRRYYTTLRCTESVHLLGDVYTEVLEATHPLHRGPTDHKRSVGPLLSLPEVHNQLFSYAHVQRETVVLAP